MLKILKNTRVQITFGVIALLLAVGALYYPGASGPYLLDDDFNLLQNKRLVIDEFSWAAIRNPGPCAARPPQVTI